LSAHADPAVFQQFKVKRAFLYMQIEHIMATMVSVTKTEEELSRLGGRLRLARLARDESMSTFAKRIGVSVPTLRAMERGSETVAIKHWANALWALDRLADLTGVLESKESVLDLARRAQQPHRRRASRRPG
jgi:hypothetical protein